MYTYEYKVSITWEFFDEYLNTSLIDDWRPIFGVPYERNTLVILAIGPHMHILLVQALSFVADPADIRVEGGPTSSGRGQRRCGPLVAVLVGYCDAWYRKFGPNP